MKIPHWFFWDYLTQYDGDKHQSYFDAYKFIKAVKGDEFNGHLRAKLKSGKVVKLYHKDSEKISQLALDLIGAKALPKIMDQDTDLMPIPNSDMIPKSGETHKIISAADRVVKAYSSTDPKHSLTLNSGLRWTSKKRPSHKESGSRNMERYEGKLTLTKKVKRPIILFDDVYTSGSQAKAACKFLTDSELEVLGVVTLAKTTHTPNKKAFEWREDVCEYDDSPFDWDSF
ncbi:hypothetical protein N9W89_12770 [Hellea sp.]|nr:hypothetical protein [Hellea sp.]